MVLGAAGQVSHTDFTAWATIAITLLLAGSAAMWKLASTLATLKGEVNKEFTHNGGNSLKDHTKAAREDAQAAKVAAEYANQRADHLEKMVEMLDKRIVLRHTEMEKVLMELIHNIRQSRTSIALLLAYLEKTSKIRSEEVDEWRSTLRAQGVHTPTQREQARLPDLEDQP